MYTTYIALDLLHYVYIQSSTGLPMLTVADFSLPHHVIIRNGETICNSCCCETVILQQSTKITSQNVSIEGDYYALY